MQNTWGGGAVFFYKSQLLTVNPSGGSSVRNFAALDFRPEV